MVRPEIWVLTTKQSWVPNQDICYTSVQCQLAACKHAYPELEWHAHAVLLIKGRIALHEAAKTKHTHLYDACTDCDSSDCMHQHALRFSAANSCCIAVATCRCSAQKDASESARKSLDTQASGR